MTKRDFELIAATIVECVLPIVGDTAIYVGIAATFADRLATTNEQFNRTRFLAACGVRAAVQTEGSRVSAG